MSAGNRARCRYCGKHRNEVGPISWAGYCAKHGVMVRDQANDDMHYHRGPYFLHWRRAMAASVGGVLVDDILEQE